VPKSVIVAFAPNSRRDKLVWPRLSAQHMEGRLKPLATVLIAGAALSGASLAPAGAMPLSNLGRLSSDVASRIQNVAYVCGPYRCGWRPGYSYAPVYVAPRVYDGCAPGWIGCGPHGYGGWYRPHGWWGYRRW
jgi:hypothetical protein